MKQLLRWKVYVWLFSCVEFDFLALFSKVFPDNFMRREVQALVVYCTFMEEGCKWKGEVRYLEVLFVLMVGLKS